MAYSSEPEMYPDVIKWLDTFLKRKFKKRKILTVDSSRRPLNRFFEKLNIEPSNKPEWQTYDIRVDVTAFIINSDRVDLAFVECKLPQINLGDISQLLGYCRVAIPIYSCIVSPNGISKEIATLFNTFNRNDVLQYYWAKGELPYSMAIATWNQKHTSPDFNTIIPSGHNFHAI